jgi:hypothetical protein
MDHSEALRLQAAEKYVLGELPPNLRDEYEDHYFDCQQCAADLKVAAAFVFGSREVFRSGPREGFEPQARSPWLRWLQPAALVPVMALLLAVLGYQTFVTVPHLKHAAETPAAGSASFISLIGANSRSGAAKTFQAQTDKPLILEVDIPVSPEYASYTCQVRDASGRGIYQSRISSQDATRTIHLIVPAGLLRSQQYELVVLGAPGGASGATSGAEVAHFLFGVAVSP